MIRAQRDQLVRDDRGFERDALRHHDTSTRMDPQPHRVIISGEALMLQTRQTAAFSLIELLIVVSLIVLLSAVLLPTIGLVRDAAYAVRCGGNIRQLQMANIQYSTEWQGQYAPKYHYDADGGYSEVWIYNEALKDLLDVQQKPNSTSMANVPIGLLCPLAKQIQALASPIAYSYGYNYPRSSLPPKDSYLTPMATWWGLNRKVAFADSLSTWQAYAYANPSPLVANSYWYGGTAAPEGYAQCCEANGTPFPSYPGVSSHGELISVA